MKVTLGGDRLGSGNKNKIALRNYERSTHNLSQKITTSMQCGVLYPFSIIPAMRGDKFVIDVNADARTIPTKGPLFGSFKMQIDYFQYPWRLAQALLHNNPLALGLKMNQVFLPTIRPRFKGTGGTRILEEAKVNNTALLKYLGISGYFKPFAVNITGRDFNAIPVLAYYEIFKTYYANKQEENAYVISALPSINDAVSIDSVDIDGNTLEFGNTYVYANTPEDMLITYTLSAKPTKEQFLSAEVDIIYNDGESVESDHRTSWLLLNDKMQSTFKRPIDITINDNFVTIRTNTLILKLLGNMILRDVNIEYDSIGIAFQSGDLGATQTTQKLRLVPFKLQNIDDMRLAILSKHTLGEAFKIGHNQEDWSQTSGTDQTGLPYSVLFETIQDANKYASDTSLNCYPLNGLVVKTYQSDLFNAWVRTEWIDGENGIAAITAISTSDGSFTIDTLNLSEKLYNMLNRVAVSDGSYEGWQDAVFTETPKRHIESPVYLGGSSSEIVFEEIVQTSQSTESSPLGTLGGKGKLLKRKGGHITVKVDEASFIIGIVSLTPRINYTQGNEWYMTDLKTMDDIHKPALDGIGFQNLIGEQLAWFDTRQTQQGTFTRSTIGKVPAWINYMTRVDKGFGDFAETDGNGFMLLQRNYEPELDEYGQIIGIKDATTYIDPQKYNYAFAYTGLDAQNFWVQIYEKVTARRLMSAKQIPNI